MIRPRKFNECTGLESLISFPKDLVLGDKNSDEIILLFVRQHKVILVFNFLLNIFVFVMPYVGLWFLDYIISNLLPPVFNLDSLISSLYASKWFVIISLVWFSYLMSNLFDAFYRWFYNINILTTERFIDVELESIFNSRVETAALTDVQDLKDSQNGVIQSIFNMGEVVLLTASGRTIFNLSNVPQAHKVRDFIMDVVVKLKKMRGDRGLSN